MSSRFLIEKLKYLTDAFTNFFRPGEQAHDQVAIIGKIVKVAGMDQHGGLVK
jgi:hypothetical protein